MSKRQNLFEGKGGQDSSDNRDSSLRPGGGSDMDGDDDMLHPDVKGGDKSR